MNEQTKTITTKLTHDIIKKDFFALHLSYLKIVEVILLCIITAFAFTLWVWTFSLENKTLAILYGIPVVFATTVILAFIVTLIKQTLCILLGKYKVITDYVTKRDEKYDITAKHLFVPHYNGLLVKRTHNLMFEKQKSFRLEKQIYYKWSPMFELNDDQIFEHAQIGTPYHLVLIGKRVVMIYKAENFYL